MVVAAVGRCIELIVAVGLGASASSMAACSRDARDGGAGRPTAPAAMDAAVSARRDAAAVVDAGPTPIAAPGGPYRGPDCAASYAPRPDRDPGAMCFVPAGTFTMGAPEGEGRPVERPQRRVTMSAFFIDQTEVTQARFAAFLNSPDGAALDCREIALETCPTVQSTGAHPWPLEVDKKKRVFGVRADSGQHPIHDIALAAAKAYCAWAGKGLPSEAQWEYAARHDPVRGVDRRYPWGDRFEKGRENCVEEDCEDGFPRTAPVGSFTGVGGRKDGASAIGALDMAGNVSEWVIGCAGGAYDACGACVDPIDSAPCGERRWVFRGGGFAAIQFESWTRVDGDAPLESSAKGFRCAAAASVALRE